MPKRKSRGPGPVPKPKSSQPSEPFKKQEPQDTTFTEIGGSPVPGLTLRHALHTGVIRRIAWSPDGDSIAFAARGNERGPCAGLDCTNAGHHGWLLSRQRQRLF